MRLYKKQRGKRGMKKRIWSLFLVVVMAMSIIPVSEVYATEKQSNTYVGENYQVTFIVDSSWDNAYNASITIQNTSTDVIDNWCIQFPMQQKIDNIWNASMIKYEDGICKIKNAEWNQDIKPGESVSFGFTAAGDFTQFPDKYSILSKKIQVVPENFGIEYSCDKNTNQEFNANVSISNNSVETIEDWYLEFDYDNEISNMWNGTILEHENQHYIIKNADYNQNITKGSEVSFGFTVKGGMTENVIKNAILYKVVNEEEIDKSEILIHTEGLKFIADNIYSVDSDLSILSGRIIGMDNIDKFYYEITNSKDKVIKSGPIEINENWSINDFGLVLGINNVKINVELKDGNKYSKEIMLFNCKNENMSNVQIDLNDNDQDGISNYYEGYFGTNFDMKDTDSDGLSDYIEILNLNTNPVEIDTDFDNIYDGDEDADEDTISNIQEINVGSNYLVKDSDADGLFDGDEIKVYLTNPNKPDTDDDTIMDQDEIILGLNPLKKDSDDNGIMDYEEKIEQTTGIEIENDIKKEILSVNVQMACPGNVKKEVKITDTYNSDMLSSEVVGLVGVPIEIDAETEFKKALITFHYDETKLADTNEEDLCMMWYDEKNDNYVLLEDSSVDIVNNTVSYNTTHFSTYLVVDKKKWNEMLASNALKNADKINQTGKSTAYAGTSTIYKCFEEGMTSDAAKAYCEKIGGHLVTITSTDEQKIIESLIKSEGSKNCYWIGAQRDGMGFFRNG